jgi:hypothetical protein
VSAAAAASAVLRGFLFWNRESKLKNQSLIQRVEDSSNNATLGKQTSRISWKLHPK